MPKFEDKIRKGQQIYKNTDNILAIKRHNEREITMLSTIHEPQMEFTRNNDPKTKAPIRTLISIIDYKSNMGAIDKADMLALNSYLLYKIVL